MEVAGAAVVAQAGPEGEHVIARSVGEGLDGREALDESLEVGDDGGDLGLLEHELGQELRVGVVAPAAPGQVSLVAVVPGEEVTAEGGRDRRCEM